MLLGKIKDNEKEKNEKFAKNKTIKGSNICFITYLEPCQMLEFRWHWMQRPHWNFIFRLEGQIDTF